MRTVITLPDHVHAKAKQRAAALGISFAEFVRRLLDRELAAPAPQGAIDSIRGMVAGPRFDMSRDGKRIIAEARHAGLVDGSQRGAGG